jgi:hypothetical protein
MQLIDLAVFGTMWGTSHLSITHSHTGNPSNPELIQIPAGQLYLVRPDSIKGSRECMCVHFKALKAL